MEASRLLGEAIYACLTRRYGARKLEEWKGMLGGAGSKPAGSILLKRRRVKQIA